MVRASLFPDSPGNPERPHIEILFDTETVREVRIVLRTGQLMAEHQTPSPITLEVFMGKIRFGFRKDFIILKTGDLVTLEGSAPHSVLALEDSILRLSMAKQDSVRVLHRFL